VRLGLSIDPVSQRGAHHRGRIIRQVSGDDPIGLVGDCHPPASRGAQVREVPIPIQGSAWPALKAAFPMTEEAWTQMISVLNAMKPGLVEAKKES
jgi:hypothetical protein